jgi:hypothetical protein
MAKTRGGFGWFLRTHYEIDDDRVVITSPTRRWWTLIALAPVGAAAVLVGFIASNAPIMLGGMLAFMLGGYALGIGMPPPARVECSAEGVRWGRRLIPAHEVEEIAVRDDEHGGRGATLHNWELEVKQEYRPAIKLILAVASLRNILVEPEARALGDAIVALVRRPAVTAQ